MRLILMRHGAGERGIPGGRLDDTGRKQAVVMAAAVRSERISRLLCVRSEGPLAVETAAIMGRLLRSTFEVWPEALSPDLAHANFPDLAKRLAEAEASYDGCLVVTNGKCASYFPGYLLATAPEDLALRHGTAVFIDTDEGSWSVWPPDSGS